MLNYLKISKARILKTLYLTPLNFFTTYKLKLKVNKELVKKQRLAYYLNKGYKLLILASTIKIKEEESTLELVILVPLLLPFRKVKGLNIKILSSLYLFKGKVPKAKKEDFKSNKSISLTNIFVINSLLKCKAGKAIKKFLRKKLKIKAIELLAFNRAKR